MSIIKWSKEPVESNCLATDLVLGLLGLCVVATLSKPVVSAVSVGVNAVVNGQNPLAAIANSSSNFDKAFAFARKWEGGYANVAGDAGGATYGGITEATARRNGISDPRSLKGNEERIKSIYRKDYWDNANCSKFKTIVGATTCLDTAINYGAAFLSLSYFAQCPESADEQHWALCIVKARRAQRYRQAARPSQTKFLAGWLNRDRGLEEFINSLTYKSSKLGNYPS